jgi:hypothetical protein
MKLQGMWLKLLKITKKPYRMGFLFDFIRKMIFPSTQLDILHMLIFLPLNSGTPQICVWYF